MAFEAIALPLSESSKADNVGIEPTCHKDIAERILKLGVGVPRTEVVRGHIARLPQGYSTGYC